MILPSTVHGRAFYRFNPTTPYEEEAQLLLSDALGRSAYFISWNRRHAPIEKSVYF